MRSRSARTFLSVLSVAVLSSTASLAEQPEVETAAASKLGRSGDSCTKTADCAEGLRCVREECQDQNFGNSCSSAADCGKNLDCVDNVCATPGTQPDVWAGAHVTIGATFGAGPALVSSDETRLDGSGVLAFRVGALFRRFELTTEVAPMTYLMNFHDAKPMLSVTGTIGGLIRMTDKWFWPMRARFGTVMVNTPDDKPMPLLGADLIGFGYRGSKSFLFEVNLPTYRFVGDFQKFNQWAWLITVTMAWVK
jgi:hypothetical protein